MLHTSVAAEPNGADQDPIAAWAKIIDHEKCIGCHACTTACKSENEVPLGVTRTFVKYVDVGTFPEARRAFQVTRCNQCEDAPCTHACPTTAMYRRPDGIVDFDKSACIGCKACIAACPYDAIFINPEDGSAEKCNFCAHRVDVGLEPACVVVCPTEAILVGDLNDDSSAVAKIAQREPVTVRRPEKETKPKLFYRGGNQAALDPLGAARPKGNLFMWSEQKTGGSQVVGGHPDPKSSQAAAVLAYDVPHKAPWDWRVSLYTLTKGISAGAYLIAGLLSLGGWIHPSGVLWRFAAPLVALAFLGITGVLLLADLEHPKRFYLIFTRPQWRSWLVRGAFIITGYGGILAAHLAASWLGATPSVHRLLLIAGIPLAVMTAVYTAWLFAQSKARDLWQSPLLPPHMLVQSALAGAAALVVPALIWETGALSSLLVVLGACALTHLLMVAGEIGLPHVTAHARVAAWEMTSGRFRSYFWLGALLVTAALAAPWVGGVAAAAVALCALIGLGCYEHAYVQAGQAVPLA